MNSVNLLQTLELIWQKKFQMHESGLILVLSKLVLARNLNRYQ